MRRIVESGAQAQHSIPINGAEHTLTGSNCQVNGSESTQAGDVAGTVESDDRYLPTDAGTTGRLIKLAVPAA
jgi:hypothetical protein